MARQSPQIGRPGQHRGQPAGEEVGEEVLAVGDAGEAPDDARRDAEDDSGGAASAPSVRLDVLTGAQPVHDVGDAEADGDRERDGGQASAQPEPLVEGLRADLGPAEERAAQTGRAEPPGRLADGPAQRILGPRWQGPEHREPEGHRRGVHRDSGGVAGGRGRRPVDEETCRGPQRVLRPRCEQEVQPRREPGHQPLVEGRASGERRRERAGGHRGGEDQPHVRRAARRRRPPSAPPSCTTHG